jgi:phospholipid transport system substrate-binding protein
MKRIHMLWVAVLFAWAGLTFATLVAPTDLVKTTTESVLARVRNDRDSLRTDPVRLHSLVDELIVPHFDFSRMSQWVLSKNWRTATDEQKTAFVNEFRNLLVRTYASALLEFSNHAIHYRPLRAPDDAKDVTVKTEVQQEGNQFVPITYRMFLKNNDWKVYDVAVDGISLLATYRSEFTALIQQKGMDGVIETLKAKNASGK